jgi:hypothetical protein
MASGQALPMLKVPPGIHIMVTELTSSAAAKEPIDNKPSEKNNSNSGREVLAISRQPNTCIGLGRFGGFAGGFRIKAIWIAQQ